MFNRKSSNTLQIKSKAGFIQSGLIDRMRHGILLSYYSLGQAYRTDKRNNILQQPTVKWSMHKTTKIHNACTCVVDMRGAPEIQALTLHSLPPLCKPLTVPNYVVSSGQFHAFSLSFPQYPRANMKGARQVALSACCDVYTLTDVEGLIPYLKGRVCQSPDLFFLVLAEGFPLTEWLLCFFVRYYRTHPLL